jgi:hypothetical protein
VAQKRSISAAANERIVIKLEPVRRTPVKGDKQRFPDTPIEPR